MMNARERSVFWPAVAEYTLACGGKPDAPRTAEVIAAAARLEGVVCRISTSAFNAVVGETLNSGDGSYRP